MKHATLLLLSSVITCQVLAQGELCSGAWLIFPGAQTSDGPASGEGASQADATNADWFSFDPTEAGYITVTSCDDGAIDSRVHVHTGDCTTLITLASDDDGCPLGYPPGNSLVANVPVVPGNLYYIEWDDRWSDNAFNWELIFHTCPVPVPPDVTVTDTSATITWETLAPGAVFTLEIGPQGFTPGTGTVITGITGVDGPPVTVNGLVPFSDYDVYIANSCSGDASPNIGPWPLHTAGNPDVPNDDCFSAQPLVCGETVTDSTTLAYDDDVPGCVVDISAPGVWYSFIGTGGAMVLRTCNAADFDTKLNVYTGPCMGLVCVAGNDDGAFCDLTSELTFVADAGTTYYVLVQGYNGATGTFSLTLDCPTCAAPQDLFASASDTEADVYWTSLNSGSDFVVEYGAAGFTPGTGTVITGTTDIDGPPAHLTGLSATTAYDVYVSEDCGVGGPSAVIGPITFTTLTDPPPTNTFCSNALPLACGTDATGNTSTAVFSPGPTCGAANINTPGLWYAFVGTGDDVTLSTCDQAAYDTKISVFEGPCAALVCAAGNDDGAGCGGNTSEVRFPTVTGAEYLVLVHGYDGATGSFTLSMECAPPCATLAPNDACDGALELEPAPIGLCDQVEGTNVCAYGTPVPNPPCDPYANIVDVWYRFNTGDHTDHTVLLNAGGAPYVNMAVYVACDEPVYITCATEVTGPIELTGLATNTDHYVRVWNGGGPVAGTFQICVETDIDNGIMERSDAALRVHPVPATDRVWIDGAMPGDAIRVRDPQGRLVRVGPAMAGSITIEHLAPGTYLLELERNGTRKSARFVRE